MELRWMASLSASALHAANALLDGKTLVDGPLAESLREPVDLLRAALDRIGPRGRAVWDVARALASGIENNRELVDVAARKSLGPSAPPTAELVGAIGRVEDAVRQALPGLADQLALRSGPPRDAWDARGPGCLTRLADLAEAELIAPRAEIVLVHPAVGGAGAAHLFCNAVTIEAVVEDPWPNLPETVRLAWLLSQLQLDLARFSEHVPPARLANIAPFAMLPPVLDAAQHVEWIESSERALVDAIGIWGLASAADDVADLLTTWWRTYLENRPTFAIALRALDRMLADAES
ncbi:MAG: hypothetical protein FJ297_15515 [Planctomycetes bacterium]|nr:hypothetical protein [Planctomycetota bacterium]